MRAELVERPVGDVVEASAVRGCSGSERRIDKCLQQHLDANLARSTVANVMNWERQPRSLKLITLLSAPSGNMEGSWKCLALKCLSK